MSSLKRCTNIVVKDGREQSCKGYLVPMSGQIECETCGYRPKEEEEWDDILEAVAPHIVAQQRYIRH